MTTSETKNERATEQADSVEVEVERIAAELAKSNAHVNSLEPGAEKYDADVARQELVVLLWSAKGLGYPVF